MTLNPKPGDPKIILSSDGSLSGKSATLTSLTVGTNAVLTGLPATANFTTLTVDNKAVLTGLPATANFTSLSTSTLTVGTTDVMTELGNKLTKSSEQYTTDLNSKANSIVGGYQPAGSYALSNHDHSNR